MSRAWRWPQPRLRPTLLLVGLALVGGAWQGTTVLFAMRVSGDATPWSRPLSWEITGLLAALACIWLPMTAVLNAPRPSGQWPRFAAVHLAAYVLFSLLKNPLMLGLRYLVYPLLGWGRYQYWYSPGHLAMEAMKDAIGYAILATAYSLVRSSRERQAQELRAAELAGELKATRLQALVGQLNPHFLMNALNTISSIMFEDVARTDRLLADLGLVLRAGFETERPTWSLAEEQAHTTRYLALLEARFADRLRVEWDVEPGTLRHEVPRFALQILVENAVKHNQDRVGALTVRLRARRDGETVLLEVEDTGRGFGAASPARGDGRGLAHLDEVLRLLYGGRGGMAREAGSDGGARVRLTLPLEARP